MCIGILAIIIRSFNKTVRLGNNDRIASVYDSYAIYLPYLKNTHWSIDLSYSPKKHFTVIPRFTPNVYLILALLSQAVGK